MHIGNMIGKYLLLQVLQKILEPTEKNRSHIVVIAELFDHLNDVYRSFLEVEMQSQVSLILTHIINECKHEYV
jgi:hypothetical protein